MFPPESISAFADAYPDAPTRLTAAVASSSLLERERIAVLADRLPTRSIEQNLGDLPKAIDPELAKSVDTGPGETVRRAHENGAWIVLKNIEQDDEYRALVDGVLGEALEMTGRSARALPGTREAFIFVSAPGSVTPFHIDPEHNILFQIEGRKTVTVYPRIAPFLEADELERFHAGGHRNLSWRPEIDEGGQAFPLEPGTALYIPVTAPHWVQNHETVSISLSVTWRSRLSRREHSRQLMNAWRRERGMPALPPTAVLARELHTTLRRLRLR